MRYCTVMTIAGSDSCGGAGIQADIKTISALGAYACCAITALTAQNTQGVRSVQGATPQVLGDQIDAVMEDMTVDAVKSGMLYSKELVDVVAEKLKAHRPKYYVLDPVMVSTSGSRLIEEDAIEAVKTKLFPLATLVTPNLPEAEVLSGLTVKTPADMAAAAKEIMKSGCQAVLMKGGHLETKDSVDMLFVAGEDQPLVLHSQQIDTKNTHGTGCTLSAAIATRLALGDSLNAATYNAHAYLHQAIEAGKDIEQGKGHGPVKHLKDCRVKD
ncbi:MAG: bifunctional hydroxymethylpyrimidine kinase/phosphomethylpyrimidine kinase [Paludibacteraceae bacterium]|nr:bifunctional hydroxymethylpyrimidine kinase/phosphomethylpyrimidine kinase [Paludibacteraceae bacterium]